MTDPRVTQLAKNLLKNSIRLKAGEKVLIQGSGEDSEALIKELVKETYAAGGLPYVKTGNDRVAREIMAQITDEQLTDMRDHDLLLMERMNCYIGFSAVENSTETSDVPAERISAWQEKYLTPVHFDRRVNHTRWVVLRWPTPAMAQEARMSTAAFEDFYFRVCNLDYGKLAEAMAPLVSLMERTDRVEIIGPGTELTFSIKDIPVRMCRGDRNIPDGEVFTAPVKDSVNGILSYNCPAVYQGVVYENIRLELREGRIIKATANDTERINKVFDIDPGARYIGEFSLGLNPFILHPMRNALFDEKIAGSFHFTPGRAYEDADNGNRSAIHWDLVCIQRPDYGGGEIRFDGQVIRKDGLFTLPELAPLNPEFWKPE